MADVRGRMVRFSVPHQCGCGRAQRGGVLPKFAESYRRGYYIALGVRIETGYGWFQQYGFKLTHGAANHDGFRIENIGKIAHHNPQKIPHGL